jgi:HlyD family secretion protein
MSSERTASLEREATGSLQDRVRSLQLPREPAGARRGSPFAWFLCLLLAGSTGYLGFRERQRLQGPSSTDASNPPAAAAKDSKAKESSTAVVAAKPAPAVEAKPAGSILLEAKGFIVPKRQITIGPKVSGMVQQMLIEEGTILKKDQPIAILESDEYRFERDRAKASYASALARWEELAAGYQPEEKEEASAELEESRAQEKQLELSFRRLSQLRRSASASADEVEQAEASWKAMAARARKLDSRNRLVTRGYRAEKIAAAKAEMEQAKAELDRAEWRLSNCTIRSPVNAVVLTKKAEQGNIVNSLAMQGSFSICELADLADLEVDLEIQERDFSKIFDGQKCKIRPEAWPDREYDGVARRMPIGNRAKGAVPVRVRISVPESEIGQYLRPEMGAVVSFLAGASKKA